MKKLLKFLLRSNIKTKKQRQKKRGFTLIELLVGLALAFLIITPLLGFVVSTMTSDRQEQAKSSSEQEIQTALDYISRDVAQAVFIYDGFGISQLSGQLPNANKAGTQGAPVLAFWKRKIMPQALPNNNDAFVMSLVAYYLIKDTSCGSSSWSCTTRIGRVEIHDGVADPNGTPDPGTGKLPYLAGLENQPSPGFNKFGYMPTGATTTGGLEGKMNLWQNSGSDIDNNTIETLIDYVDQTTVANNAPITPCSLDPRGAPRPDVTKAEPTAADLAAPYPYRQSPDYTAVGAVPANLQTGSFYACVNAENTLAQVFIRGNALARNKPKNNPPSYVASQSSYFPKASIQVQGRGLIIEQAGG